MWLKYTLLVLMAVGLSSIALCQENPKITVNYQQDNLHTVFKDLRKRYQLKFAYDVGLAKSFDITCLEDSIVLDDFLLNYINPLGLESLVVGDTRIIVQINNTNKSTSENRTNFTLSGQIKDRASGESLPFATVFLPFTEIGTIANMDGFFSLANIPSDTSMIEIKYIGYIDLVVQGMDIDSLSSVVLTMKKGYATLPLVSIYGNQSSRLMEEDEPSTVTIDARLVSEMPNHGEVDLFRTSQLNAGISASSESSDGLEIRGAQSEETGVYYDGFTLYHVDHMFGAFSGFNEKSVKHIRIQKGWMSAKYGGRASGMLSLTSMDGNATKFESGVSMTPISLSGFVSTPILDEQWTLMLSGRRSFTDVIQSQAYSDQISGIYNRENFMNDPEVSLYDRTAAPDFFFYDLSAKLTFKPNKRDKYAMTYYGGRDVLNLPSEEEVGSYDESKWGSSGAGLQWTRKWNRAYYSSLSMGMSTYKNKTFSVNIDALAGEVLDTIYVDRESEIRELNLSYDHELFFDEHTLQFGLQFKDRSTYSKFNVSGELNEVDDKFASETALYLHDKFKIWKAGECSAGVRAVHWSGDNQLYVEPRFSLSHALNSQFKLYGAVASHHQMVRRTQSKDLYTNRPDIWNLAKDDIPVLSAVHYILGVELLIKKWNFRSELFFKDLQNVVEEVFVFPQFPSGYMFGKGRVVGAEVTTTRKFDHHELHFAYTIQSSQKKFDQLENAWVYSSGDHRHEGKMTYGLNKGRFQAMAVLVLASGARYTPLAGTFEMEMVNGAKREIAVYGDLNSGKLPLYHRMDVAVNYLFYPGKVQGKVGFSIYNVYNHRNFHDRRYFYTQQNGVTVIDKYKSGMIPSLKLDLIF